MNKILDTLSSSRLLSLALCLIFIHPANGQELNHTLRLKAGNIAMRQNVSKWVDSMGKIAPSEPVLTYIHFEQLPTRSERELLKRQGVTLLDYMPENSFSAYIQFPLNSTAITQFPVHSFVNVLPEWKADEYVWNNIAKQSGTTEVLVTFYPTTNEASVRQFVKAIAGQIHAGPMEQYGLYKIIIDADKIRSLAEWYGVQNISPVTEMYPLDLQSRPAVKGNIAVKPIASGGYGLAGDSVTVGVGDNASGIYHADLKDRITNFNPAPKSAHGAHVNGIVGGAANIDPLAEGMAPHVSLVDYLYDQVLPATGAMLRDYNMTITNNSYGVLLGSCSYSGTYDGYSRFLDSLARRYPEVLHVFASGNDGYLSCSPYPPGFATVGGGYQPAKNIVVVGSMTDFLGQASDESRGPTKDGRMKPEIIAIGLGAYSTIGMDEYEWAAGTSMASPQVAGGVAILTQRFKQVMNGTAPLSDELKAILLNGAMDLGNPGPDFSYGFGAMDLSRSLKIIDNKQFFNRSISNGDTQITTINVPANTAQLKVMLYYNDVPASTSSATQLVNDLDLTVNTPSGATHLPLNPDPTPANVDKNATEHADHLNNVEQVTINSPSVGSYAIVVSGTKVPTGPQRFVVAYDFVPTGVQLTYPSGGEQIRNVNPTDYDTLRIFWNAIATDHSFSIQFSSNDGANWTTLADSISGTSRYFAWKPQGINSGLCKMRVLRNGTSDVSTSGRFIINNEPSLVVDTAQCPGYINLHWKKVPNTSYYQMLRKNGAYMELAGITADTFYSFSGMPLNSKSYVAVRPVINGTQGYRSVAAIVTANSGHCMDSISRGDLMIEKVLSPTTGRRFTSTANKSTDTLNLLVRNLYNADCDSYRVDYQINGGAWVHITDHPLIKKNNVQFVYFPPVDLSQPGTYNITVSITNLAIPDPQHDNDTLRFAVTNIANDTMTLPFADGFESMGKLIVSHDSLCIAPNGHWDFLTNDSAGRVRSFVSDEITISGNRSISLDENQNVRSGSKNMLVGTFNLGAYDTATSEIRMDFDYVLHGFPQTATGNLVSVRSNDMIPWSPLFYYDLNAYPGFLNHARSISLTDAARFESTNFSSSYQLAFGQNDTSVIAAANYGNGITFDNVKIYTVANDAQLVQVVTPQPTNCGLTGPQSVTVEVHNGVNYTLHNIQLNYSLDSGTVQSGTIDSITAKSNINFTFPMTYTVAVGTTHKLDVWLTAPGDTYALNDSLLHYKFRNNPIITTYPYLENFETGDGGYYSDGISNSWQYGTPASTSINKAASGMKAWKTNLKGRYNNLEQSYLYSPCFDIGSLANPMLSYSAALDIENCGNTLCDRAYIEYTYDGVTWTKLGKAGQGTNWYDSTFNAWNTNGFTRWHVASIPIPLPVGGGQTINFRFALNSDPGATFEGFAIDDIHIFDRKWGVFPTNSTTVTMNLSGNNWVNFLQSSNQLVASINPATQTIAGTSVSLYEHDTIYNPGATQYTFPRSYNIQAPVAPTDSVGIRLFLKDSDVVAAYNDLSCLSCNKIADAYSLGITQFDNPGNIQTENNTLADDSGGTYTFYPYKNIKWVPFDNGYYAEFKAKPFSEFWFNDGGPTGNVPAGIDYLHFTAIRKENDAQINWQSLIDTGVATYMLQRSYNDTSFPTIFTAVPQNSSPASYAKTDSSVFPAAPVLYYRLKWTMKGKTDIHYSPIRRVDNLDSAGVAITFDATAIDRNTVIVNWTSFTDGNVNHYILEREKGGGSFDTIYTPAALGMHGHRYKFTDLPPGITTGPVSIKYRLTAILNNGTTITLPVQVVQIPDANSVPIFYPNPSANDNINITWYADAGTTMKINLTDITGKTIFKTSAIATQWTNKTTITIPLIAKGLYLLNISVNGQSYLGKVVFE